jgi:hypothetical protein
MAEIGKVQRNSETFHGRHAPGTFDLFVRKPLAQLAGTPFEAIQDILL